MELVSVQKRLFSATSASIYGIACACPVKCGAYFIGATYFTMYVSAQSLDFLDLAKNSSFLVRKLIGPAGERRWS